MTAYPRVAITGVGVVAPLGKNFPEFITNLFAEKSSVIPYPEWKEHFNLSTAVASPVADYDYIAVDRKLCRNMTRVALLSVDATDQAIKDAGLTEAMLTSQRTGISYGSCMGGVSEIERLLDEGGRTEIVRSATSATYLKIMPHTCAANLAVYFAIPGRVIASCTACASSTQAIGYGYESIRAGVADRMLCGGAEELSAAVPAIFDVLRATSSGHNDAPQTTPRPFDANRDGIVVGEGAGTVVLENWDQAVARGAKIYGEVKGFYTNNDATHMTNPSVEGLKESMQGALDSAGISAAEIGYINAHATGTEAGDLAEALAIKEAFPNRPPVSASKGNFGHLMGATGIVETLAAIAMMKERLIIPTLNLTELDPKMAGVNLIQKKVPADFQYFLKNSFAFGGVNASLVIARV